MNVLAQESNLRNVSALIRVSEVYAERLVELKVSGQSNLTVYVERRVKFALVVRNRAERVESNSPNKVEAQLLPTGSASLVHQAERTQ
jgi:hypothetical protein